MPPDTAAFVNKFIPNNPKLSRVLLHVLEEVFRSRFLPKDLVQMMAKRAFELANREQMEVDSSVFYEKLKAHAVSLQPRFMAKITANRRAVRK